MWVMFISVYAHVFEWWYVYLCCMKTRVHVYRSKFMYLVDNIYSSGGSANMIPFSLPFAVGQGDGFI